ncbi:NAD-dependent epimerase/dehydratase family protein [Candidatus Synechococcus calcipolaris G9]|uniref:NAD-dependent epimerase/dehydratase family protein n=1 Tax=Candidatus Synechococcus calcipolaris G9 TaxID=1497997 RepID=A0ABT6EXG1_9SYNE|nr:hopanoid-associated sugar epimerase [Candidatus Synechococcus calcipolaris]MDG2990052.1 NAD-dependent epimerase/dehydratase family protein [Candidatus Synechococcus calcipolaris G9]
MAVSAFVTGASGFVGTNLVHLLVEKGYQIRALVRNPDRVPHLHTLGIDLIPGDLNVNPADLAQQMQGCSVLFHVAAHYSLWQRDRDILHQSNVLGTRNILAAARQAGIERTVYTSSVAAIGVDPSGQPGTEAYQSPPEKLIGDYKKSKYWAEQEAVNAVQQGQDIVIVNPSTPIGPWDAKPTPTGEMILKFLRGQMPVYVETGLNLIHVRDVVMGHLLALEKGKRGDRYILGHQNLTLGEILNRLATLTGLPRPWGAIPIQLPLAVAWIDEMLLTKLGKPPSVPIAGVQMARQKMFYDASKAVKELGLPQSPIDQALQDAIDWFQEHGYA